MTYHIEILLFELIKLYQDNTYQKEINLSDLKDAFYILQNIINEKGYASEFTSFEDVVETLQEYCHNSIKITPSTLIIIDDIEIIFDELLLKLSKLTAIDWKISTYAHSLDIYEALNIPIPLAKTAYYFSINNQIIQTYLMLAKHELEGKDSKILFLQLHYLLCSLDELINNADKDTLNELRVCCEYYNDLYLIDSDEPFINTPWHIILFSKISKQLKSIGYTKLLEAIYLKQLDLEDDCNNQETIYYDDSHDNENDESNDCEETYEIEEEETEDEISIFFGLYLYYLNILIEMFKNTLSKEIIESLTIKAYLLLSIPELQDSESIFIERHEIAKPIVIQNSPSFLCYFNQATECLENLNISDIDIIKNPSLYTELIVNAIFIRCFLELAKNNDKKEELITIIVNENIYKNPNFNIVTKLIDDIIFNENLDFSLTPA